MANYCYLYSSSEPGPPDPDADPIAEGRYLTPAFWLASFSLDDIYLYEEDGEEMPYVDLPVASALGHFE